jgi:hypothetical protein
MEIDDQNEHKQLKYIIFKIFFIIFKNHFYRTSADTSHSFPVKTGVYYTVHRDE